MLNWIVWNRTVFKFISILVLDRNKWNHSSICKKWALAHLKMLSKNVLRNHIYVLKGLGIRWPTK